MRNAKKLIALVLALVMSLSVLVLPSFAEETQNASHDLSLNAPAPKTIFDIKNEDGSPVKIACIGDSITYGYTIDERELYSYPAMLGAKLGDGYEVGNFGKSASYILPGDSEYNERTDKTLSYRDTQQYQDSIAFAPDIVIIMLGTNDVTSFIDAKHEAVIEEELENIIKIYQNLESVERVYVMTSIFAPYNYSMVKLSDGPLQKIQQRAARDTGAEFVDIYSLTRDYFDVMLHLSDRLHPDEDSYEAIPSACYALLTGTEYTPLVAPTVDTGVVYVSSSGSSENNDGLTPETPVGSIAYAAGLLRENGGTIVVCGDYAIYKNNGTHMPKTNGTIKITSNYGGVDYKTSGAQIKLNSTYFYLGGVTEFDDVNFHSTSNSIIVCNYHDMKMGDGVVCTAEDGKANPLILSGHNVANGAIPAEMVTLYGNCNIEINGGSWTYLRNGNRRNSASSTVGTIAEGACLTATINGGTFAQLDTNNNTAATGMNSVAGDCNLIINGGSFAGRIYGISRSGDLGEGVSAPVCTGNVNVYINNGMFAATVRGRQDNTVISKDAKVSLTLSERYRDRINDFYTFDSITFVDDSTVITTPDALIALMNDPSKWSGHYVLGADIDLTAYTGELTQKPIGNYDVPFTGMFEGAGHKIEGINIVAEGPVGLFGCIERAQVRNIDAYGAVKNTFAASNAETKYTADGAHHATTGMIAGMVFTHSEVINCSANGTVEGKGNVGGVIGMVKNLGAWTINVQYCDNYAAVTNSLGNTGGVISRVTSLGTAAIGAKLIGCNNYADLTNKAGDRQRLAGIVGYFRIETNQIIVDNCVNYGDLSGTNSSSNTANRPHVGGITGRAEVTYPSGGNATQKSSLIVTQCRNEGDINSSYMGGGLFGYFQRSSKVTGEISFTECENKGNVSATTYAGGIVSYVQNENASLLCKIDKCANYGSVTSNKGSGSGGLIGRVRGCTITNCFSSGEVIGTTRTNLGGLFGISAAANSTATNCYAVAGVDTKLVGVDADTLVLVDCAFVEEAGVKNSYAGFDFTDAWTIRDGLPVLDCFTTEATGDVDADGTVSNADITLAVRHLAGYDIEYRTDRFDLTGDGKLNNRDAIELIRMLVNTAE